MPTFSQEAVVIAYHKVIERLESAKGTEKKKLQADAKKRLAWKKWQGEDSLYEMAFGEPY